MNFLFGILLFFFFPRGWQWRQSLFSRMFLPAVVLSANERGCVDQRSVYRVFSRLFLSFYSFSFKLLNKSNGPVN